MTFDDCIDKKPLQFDFYLIKENKIIEFDGEGHFMPIFGEESFKGTQKRDKIKDIYCIKNNIPILRIPYWFRNYEDDLITDFL